MYGQVKKCKTQLEIDQNFLKDCDQNFHDRKKASKYFVERGWDYFYSSKMDTAMMRFNQAWLLDSLNADVYWGFGNLVGVQKKYKVSIALFNKSIQLNGGNAKVWEGKAISFGQLFFETKQASYLNRSVECLRTAIQLDPNNTRFYAALTSAYSYYNQKDSAAKYLKITDKLDSKAVTPDIRKIIMQGR